MKTQLSVLVKNESLYSRCFSFLWFINIFRKMSVNVWIDQDPDVVKNPTRVLKASNDPYEIDLVPGPHTVYFSDPRAASKARFRVVTGAFVGASFAAGAGGSMLAGASVGADMGAGNSVGVGYASFFLQDGDIFKISAKPTRKGGVKVKQIKEKKK